MQLKLRVLFIICVLTILLSGLGYDPLSRLIPGVAPYTLPALLLAAVLFMQWVYTSGLEQQLAENTDRTTAALKTERAATSARFHELAATTTELDVAVRTMRQVLSEQEVLVPAKILLVQRRFDEATKMLHEIVEQLPNSTEAHWLLGEALLGNKRHTEALPYLDAGLAHDDPHRLSLIAQCEQTLGHHAEAEKHLLRLIEVRGDIRQQDLVALGAAHSEVVPARATATLTQALDLNPFNSAARYQLMELQMRAGAFDKAIALATEGLERNAADTGCFVSRAEALYRRGRIEDEHALLHDLAQAQVKNRRDYNIYRLRGAFYQRQASRAATPAERRQALREAVDAYEEGLTHVPAKFQAHLLAAESRVFLQLKRFEEAIKVAQRAVDHSAGHVSNHLALALARLAAGQWRSAAQAADHGLQWAGWGGRIWLTAVAIFANTCAGADPDTLQQKCATLAADLAADGRRFELSETWSVVRVVLSEAKSNATESGLALVRDTIALLEHAISPEDYQRTWGHVHETHEVA